MIVDFNASGSLDVDGDTLIYSWSFGDGPAGSGAMPSHTYSSAGTYTVRVTVSDGEFQDSATMAIEVAPPPCNLTCSVGLNVWPDGIVANAAIQNNGTVNSWQAVIEFTQNVIVSSG